MERQLLERLIGAGVLVILLVIIAPAILDGEPDPVPMEAAPAEDQPRRTHTIRLDKDSETPPVARQVEDVATKRPTPEEQPVVAKEIAPAPEPEPEAEPEPEPKPEPKPEAAPKPAPVVVAKPVVQSPKIASGWAVQLGSFSSQENAGRLVKEVKRKGFSGYLMPLNKSGKTLYRVRVGPVSTKDEATQLAARLSAKGYNGQVARQEPTG